MKTPKLHGMKYNILAGIITLFVIIGCQHEHPPMNEYQVVGYVPIDSVRYGKLFISGNSLFVLYDTTYNNYWTKMKEYDLSNPLEPILINTDDLEPINPHYYITHQDSFIFFHNSYDYLQIFNLHTLQSVNINIDYYINSLVYKNNHVFISSYSGLRIWDITNLPNYTEVFNDSIHRWNGCISYIDTILFETYDHYGENEFKFWNIKNPDQPQMITQGDFSYDFFRTDITNQFIIGFYYASIYRFKYDFSDSLIFEESCSFDYYDIDESKLSNTYIYLLLHDYLNIIKIDDFDEQWIISFRDDYYYYNYYSVLSQEIYNNKIYLFSKRGIHIFERRES
ncbi:MAG: hypothetical protein E3J47_06795 [Candidatus Stahlbacteria bacterium]|nr:MAG: hypothetical protein E3J47_06795 [Candidatus Stahlbacteria bacterium]